MTQQALHIQGLSQLSRSLKKIDGEAAKGLRVACNDAADFLISKVRPQIPVKTGAARASLKPRSTRTAVRIGVGGRRAPYYPWLDFGGSVGRRKRTKREFIKEGRYIYPTLRRERRQFETILQGALVKVASGAGLEVS